MSEKETQKSRPTGLNPGMRLLERITRIKTTGITSTDTKVFHNGKIKTHKKKKEYLGVLLLATLISNLLRNLAKKTIGPVINGAKTILEGKVLGGMTSKVVKSVSGTYHRLANIETNLKQATYGKEITNLESATASSIPNRMGGATIVHEFEPTRFSKTVTAAGTFVNGMNIVGRTFRNGIKSGISAVPMTLVVGGLTGFHPIPTLLTAGVATSMNFLKNTSNTLAIENLTATQFNKLRWTNWSTLVEDSYLVNRLGFEEYNNIRYGGLVKQTIINGKEILTDVPVTKLNSLTKSISKMIDINKKYGTYVRSMTGYMNWGSIGAIAGVVLAPLLHVTPTLGLLVGTGGGALAKKVATIISPKILPVQVAFKAFSSVAVAFAANYARMAQSGYWATKFFKDFQNNKFKDAWRNETWGWQGVGNIFNMGLFAFNYISLDSMVISGATKALGFGLLKLGFSDAAGAIGVETGASVATGVASGIVSSIGGSIIGFGIGLALFGVGGGGAIAAGVVGGAIGAVIGGAIGLYFGVPNVGEFIGRIAGYTLGYGVGRAFESITSSISGGYNLVLKSLSLINLFKTIHDLELNKGWGISKMIALAIALMGTASLFQMEGDQFNLKTNFENTDKTASLQYTYNSQSKNNTINRLNFIYKDKIFASKDIQGAAAGSYVLSKPSIISETALNIASNLEVGYFDMYNRDVRSNILDLKVYKKWKKCYKQNKDNIFVCNDMVQRSAIYTSIDLVYETFHKIGIPLIKTKTAVELYNRYSERKTITPYMKISKLQDISPGMIVFITDVINPSKIKRVGIISEVTKDYIMTTEANSNNIKQYYVLNFNGKYITSTNSKGEIIVGYLSLAHEK